MLKPGSATFFWGLKIVAPLTFLAPGTPFCKAITSTSVMWFPIAKINTLNSECTNANLNLGKNLFYQKFFLRFN